MVSFKLKNTQANTLQITNKIIQSNIQPPDFAACTFFTVSTSSLFITGIQCGFPECYTNIVPLRQFFPLKYRYSSSTSGFLAGQF